jgi:hypothetical protein
MDGRRGGGVRIYVKSGMNFKKRNDLENYKLHSFENLVLKVQCPNKNVISLVSAAVQSTGLFCDSCAHTH